MPDRRDRAQIAVAEDIVEIPWSDREALLEKLETLDGCDTIVAKFDEVGASRPVHLDDEQRSRLRVALELWGVSVLPDGLARLLIALVRADPSG